MLPYIHQQEADDEKYKTLEDLGEKHIEKDITTGGPIFDRIKNEDHV